MIETIIFIIVVIIVFFILNRITKSLFIFKIVFRIVSIFLALFLAIIIVTSLMVLNDANNFRKNFANSSNLFILNANGSFISGIVLNNADTDPFAAISQDKLDSAWKEYDRENIAGLTKGYYKVFIVDIKALDDLEYTRLKDKNVDLEKSEVIRILLSKTPKNELSSIIAKDSSISNNDVLQEMKGMDNDGLKAYLFSYSLTSFFDPENTDNFLIELKKGNIRVYEETMMFKAIRLVPKFLINDILKKQGSSVANETLIKDTDTAYFK
jgi:hypothetical protein